MDIVDIVDIVDKPRRSEMRFKKVRATERTRRHYAIVDEFRELDAPRLTRLEMTERDMVDEILNGSRPNDSTERERATWTDTLKPGLMMRMKSRILRRRRMTRK
jgi:hypothetical protein